ncbi:MAG TPA: cytochrome c biogenesis protein CcdA [Mycobacteriales bacterium]|nr:cytochrome c biogenesis protein CcdA [Mycobacteriales bacterium]
MLLAVVVAFGAGVVSFLAPCTVPLLPAYVGVLSGSSAGRPVAEQPRRLLIGSLLYVLGFTAVFVTLGLLAGSVGSAVRRAGGPVQRGGGVLVLVLALLVLLDARLGLLARVSSGDRGRSRLARSSSAWVPLLLGVVFGTAFTPCVGPFLAGVLTLAAREGGALTGGALLGVYSLGLGAPFVLAALGVSSSAPLTGTLARWSRPVSVVGGVLLAVLGVAMLTGEYGRVAGLVARVLPFPTV